MHFHPGKLILALLILFLGIYAMPQLVSGTNLVDSIELRTFLAMIFICICAALAGLMFLDDLTGLDRKIRDAAGSPVFVRVGFSLLAISTLLLIAFMIPWNDENSNVETARYLWDHGLRSYFNNYTEINQWLGRHHPPLLVLFYGLFYKLTGFSLIAGRLLNFVFALGAAVFYYKWIRRLTDEAIAGMSMITLAFVPMWAFSSASALLDMPFTFLFAGALYYFDGYIGTAKTRYALIAGGFALVAILSRYNGLFLYPIWLVTLLADKGSRGLLKRPATYLPVLITAVLSLPWLALAAYKGTLLVQITRLSQFLFVAGRSGGWWYLTEVLLILFPIMFGVFNLPLWLFGAASYRKIMAPETKRLLAALITYTLLIAFTLPNPRYVIPAIPMLAALASVGVWRIAAAGKGAATVLAIHGVCAIAFLFFYTYGTAQKWFYIFY